MEYCAVPCKELTECLTSVKITSRHIPGHFNPLLQSQSVQIVSLSKEMLVVYGLKCEVSINHNWYQTLNISGLIDPIIGPNISAVQTTAAIIGSALGGDDEVRQRLPVAAARTVEPRFDDNSVNNSLVKADIGESVALHCNIWMKQVTNISFSKMDGFIPSKFNKFSFNILLIYKIELQNDPNLFCCLNCKEVTTRLTGWSQTSSFLSDLSC